ncbi:hypothetical protein [Streptomyces sp. NPDC051776]
MRIRALTATAGAVLLATLSLTACEGNKEEHQTPLTRSSPAAIWTAVGR